MSPQDFAFYVLSVLTLLCGTVVITKLDPVTSAMFLVLCIVCLAGLFVLLQAFFLAAVQVLVYAGAVMVLFLFVIMLLDLKAEERRKVNLMGAIAGVVSVGAIFAIFLRSLAQASPLNVQSTPTLQGGTIR